MAPLAVAQLRQLAIVGADPSPLWSNLVRSTADPVRVAVLVEQQGADETEAPSGTLWSGSGIGAAVWRPCGRRGHASFLRIWESTSARRRRGPLGGSRSSLLAGQEAPWHSGAPLPRPTVSTNVLGCVPCPASCSELAAVAQPTSFSLLKASSKPVYTVRVVGADSGMEILVCSVNDAGFCGCQFPS